MSTAVLVLLEATVEQTNGDIISITCSSWRLNEIKFRVKVENGDFYNKTYTLSPNKRYVVPYIMDLFDPNKNAGFYPYKWKLNEVKYIRNENTVLVSWSDNISGALTYPDTSIIDTYAEPIFRPYQEGDVNGGGGATDPRVDLILEGALYPSYTRYIKGDGSYGPTITTELAIKRKRSINPGE